MVQPQHGRLFTTSHFLATAGTEMELRWGWKTGKWISVVRGVNALGNKPASPYEIVIARAMASSKVAPAIVSARLLGLDSIALPAEVTRCRTAPISPEPLLVNGIWCLNGLQTLVGIAPLLDDLEWEQALESALRKGLLKLDELLDAVPLLTACRNAGTPRIRRVLDLRPPGAPPTGSLLETLAVQMCRANPNIPDPVRQHEVVDRGGFRSFLDLSWPDLGSFTELDGEGHKLQPVYDANRETRVVAATGWLCARLTWTEVRHVPRTTGRRVAFVLEQARRRPFRD